MSFLTRTMDAARAARDVLRGTAPKGRGEPPASPPSGWEPIPPQGLHTITLAGLRRVLDEHDAGNFLNSGLLAESFLRNPYVAQALRQRTLSVLGAPLCVEGDPALAAEVRTLWPRICPRAVEGDLLRSAVMEGFGVARVTYEWADDLGDWLPRLRSWHPSNVYYDPSGDGVWQAITKAGQVPITPGQGWVLYTPESEARPWIYGAVRATGEWALSQEQVARNARRHSEVLGQGVWLAKTPNKASNADGLGKFLAALRNLGRAGVIELPQGSDEAGSFGLDLVESKGEGWQGFQWLTRTAASAIRLVILGQDLTSEHGDVGKVGSSAVGDSVREDLALDDAVGEGECLTEQLLAPWVRWRYGQGANLTVRRGVERKQDELRQAQAKQARSAAYGAVALALPALTEAASKAGVEIDVEELLESVGVPLKDDDDDL